VQGASRATPYVQSETPKANSVGCDAEDSTHEVRWMMNNAASEWQGAKS